MNYISCFVIILQIQELSREKMDQIKKRLEIIKIAIFISDNETIRLQLLKLEYFQENEQLNKIMDLLKHKSYGQAQVLISEYLNNQPDSNKENKKEDNTQKNEDDKKSIIEEFGLLKPNDSIGKYTPDSSGQNTKENKRKESTVSYVTNYKDFKLSSDEIEKIPTKKQAMQEMPAKTKVDFSDIFLSLTNKKEHIGEAKEVESKIILIENTPKIQEEVQEDIKEEIQEDNTPKGDMETPINIEKIKAHSVSFGTQNSKNKESGLYDTKYPPIPDIFHRFKNIALFNIDDKNYTLSKSAANWMNKISSFGYKDIEILKISKYIQRLKENKQIDEAIQLTLICSATESNLGKLIFARELYKGDIFEKDHIKACEMTKELALLDYPEALCDLGQYCEYGIGTKKNLEYALHFYKKAHDLGLERANILYKNLKRKKGFFSFLFKSEH